MSVFVLIFCLILYKFCNNCLKVFLSHIPVIIVFKFVDKNCVYAFASISLYILTAYLY